VRRPLLAALLALAGLLAASVPAAAAKNRWIQKKAPFNIAHQGGEDEFPSNTLYAFRKALRVGADMLELDIGVTKDDKVIVMHDTTVNGKTNGTGTVSSLTLRQIKRLDAAYWFAPKAESHYSHDLPAAAYRLRGIATGAKKPPRGFRRSDFRVPTLRQVLRAFPHTPINVEIKGRTPQEDVSEYLYNAEVLAKLLKGTKRRDLIVVSFQQPAVDRFHELAPSVDLAPGLARPRRRGLPGAAHVRTDRHHDRGARGACPPGGLRLAELVLGRRSRRPGRLAQPDRHVRGRHDDVAPTRLRARAAGPPAAEELQEPVLGR
jgi:glycerophosphoryl diester phosphodiesterase